MKLSFQPYKDLHKRTPYVAVASFLVQTVSGIREGNEVQVEDESDFNVYASDAAMSTSVEPIMAQLSLDNMQATFDKSGDKERKHFWLLFMKGYINGRPMT